MRKLWGTFIEGIIVGMVIVVFIVGARGCSAAHADELSEAKITVDLYQERLARLKAEYDLTSARLAEALARYRAASEAQKTNDKNDKNDKKDKNDQRTNAVPQGGKTDKP